MQAAKLNEDVALLTHKLDTVTSSAAEQRAVGSSAAGELASTQEQLRAAQEHARCLASQVERLQQAPNPAQHGRVVRESILGLQNELTELKASDGKLRAELQELRNALDTVQRCVATLLRMMCWYLKCCEISMDLQSASDTAVCVAKRSLCALATLELMLHCVCSEEEASAAGNDDIDAWIATAKEELQTLGAGRDTLLAENVQLQEQQQSLQQQLQEAQEAEQMRFKQVQELREHLAQAGRAEKALHNVKTALSACNNVRSSQATSTISSVRGASSAHSTPHRPSTAHTNTHEGLATIAERYEATDAPGVQLTHSNVQQHTCEQAASGAAAPWQTFGLGQGLRHPGRHTISATETQVSTHPRTHLKHCAVGNKLCCAP